MSQSVKQLKKQLMGAACAVLMSAVALSSATYAWYVANNTVKATSSTISATTNGFILQIDELRKGAQHGGEQTSLAAAIQGGKITPSSTDDLKNWFVCQGWGSDGRVTSYSQIKFKQDGKSGEYEAGGETHYAYLKSEFIVYTITESGIADVYLEGSDGEPIVVTAHGTPTTYTIPNSLRIGITTQAIDANGDLSGDETLRSYMLPLQFLLLRRATIKMPLRDGLVSRIRPVALKRLPTSILKRVAAPVGLRTKSETIIRLLRVRIRSLIALVMMA